MTPVRSMDCRHYVGHLHDDGAAARFVRGVDRTGEGQSTDCGAKEPNPVEFRSGYRGVSWNRRMKAWLAFWSEGKNRRSKTFNAKVMGFDKARAAAIDFLKKKKQLLQQLDPSYSDTCNSGALTGGEEEDYGEGGSLADSATTTSDSPNSSEMYCCSVCGASGHHEPGTAGGMGLFGTPATEDCCCGTAAAENLMSARFQ